MAAIHEVQQKSGFKNLLLEKKLTALADTLEKKVITRRQKCQVTCWNTTVAGVQEAQLNEVLAASNLDPSALTMVTRKLEDVLDAKNSAIRDLQYELARVCKVHSLSLLCLWLNLQVIWMCIITYLMLSLSGTQWSHPNLWVQVGQFWNPSGRAGFQATAEHCGWTVAGPRACWSRCFTLLAMWDYTFPCTFWWHLLAILLHPVTNPLLLIDIMTWTNCFARIVMVVPIKSEYIIQT